MLDILTYWYPSQENPATSRPAQCPHQAAHLQRLEPIAPAQVALDASPLQRLLHRVGGEHSEDHRHARFPRYRSNPLAGFRHHHIEVGRITADHRTKGDHHLVAPTGGKVLRNQGQFKRSRHPGHIQLAARCRSIHTMTCQTIQATTQQLGRD